MRKTVITVLLILLLAMALVLLGAYNVYRHALQEIKIVVQDQEMILARQTAKNIQYFFDTLKGQLTLLARLKPVQQMTPVSNHIVSMVRESMGISRVTIFRLDANGICTYMNPATALEGVIGKDFSFRPYFQEIRRTHKPTISDYLTAGGQRYGDVKDRFQALIIAVPILGDHGRFLGVLGTDVRLSYINEAYIKPVRMGNQGYAWMLDGQGRLLGHPQLNLLGKLSQDCEHSEELCRLERDHILRGEEGRGEYTKVCNQRRVDYLVAYTPVIIDHKHWSVLVSMPLEEAEDMVAPIFLRLTIISGSIVFLFILGAVVIAKKALQAQRLKQEVINKELEFTRQIQESILPTRFPQGETFCLYAHNIPAKMVSGDFYDFFQIDPHQWALVIADVSDKGMPAALFMSSVHSLIRGISCQDWRPATMLARVNQQLSEENPTCMFVTLFFGVLDTRTGTLDYANGGHLPALVLRAEGSVERLARTGMALGIDPTTGYEQRQVTLNPGDLLVLYTDGITEAQNQGGEDFGLIRLEETLKTRQQELPQTLVEETLNQVKGFSIRVAQADDMTLMILKMEGKSEN
ncbi:MAG: SpoIIE family protein phosphatase [Deltaproteobacteria bacterium]|nr:SpoIIE family protein phosphatase [Deltaproteobacteria bacterium]